MDKEYQKLVLGCQNCKQNFVIEPDDFLFYEKIKVPPPTWCPECRMIRRLIWRNERSLYKKESDFTGKSIFSGYSPDSLFKIYEDRIWNSDEWDPKEMGREYDFSRPFIEQFMELHKSVPRPAIAVIDMVNSDYCNNATEGKNCYLLFSFAYCEDCMYGSRFSYCKDSLDSLFINKSEFVYESFQIDGSSHVFYSSLCKDSINVYFSKNLKNCQNCFGCVNLNNKNYCIFNEQYTKDEYSKKINEFAIGSYSSVQEIKKQIKEFWLKFPNKFMSGISNYEVSGEYINNSKNVKKSYNVNGGEDIKYSQFLYVPSSRDIYDTTLYGDNSENIYESVHVGLNISNFLFCTDSWTSLSNISYCVYCTSSSDLFGCVGIRKGQYMILNRQYTKSEYEELVPKIIRHMSDMPYIDSKGRIYKYGEFFPSELSPFAYNETIAQEYYPLTKEQAIQQGYKWKDKEERNYTIDIHTEDIPDSITDIEDQDILNKVIECSHKGTCNQQCTEAFKIIPEELSFYRRMNLPLPHLCPNCRHYERLAQRNPMKLWHRSCMKEGCTNTFETSYSPERPEIVYCERCYQNEVY
jgi:hypothetical protein